MRGRCGQGLGWLNTNFHLPKSSLLVLVCAGKDLVLASYRHEQRYCFFSYGERYDIRTVPPTEKWS